MQKSDDGAGGTENHILHGKSSDSNTKHTYEQLMGSSSEALKAENKRLEEEIAALKQNHEKEMDGLGEALVTFRKDIVTKSEINHQDEVNEKNNLIRKLENINSKNEKVIEDYTKIVTQMEQDHNQKMDKKCVEIAELENKLLSLESNLSTAQVDNLEKLLKQNEYDKKIYFEVLERVKFDSEKANADIEDTIKRLEVRFRKLIEDLEKEYSIFDHECGMRRKFPQKLWCCLNR